MTATLSRVSGALGKAQFEQLVCVLGKITDSNSGFSYQLYEGFLSSPAVFLPDGYDIGYNNTTIPGFEISEDTAPSSGLYSVAVTKLIKR